MRAQTRNRLWSAALWTALVAALVGIVATARAFDASVLLPVMDEGGTPIPALAWYRLDGDATDSSGNGYNGTWAGTEAYSDSGAYFDGASRISDGTVIGNVGSNAAMTVSLWAKDLEVDPLNTDMETLVCKVVDVNNGRPGWGLYKRGSDGYSGVLVRCSEGTTFVHYKLFTSNMTTNVWDGTWKHLAVVFDPVTSKLYGYYQGEPIGTSATYPASAGMFNGYALGIGSIGRATLNPLVGGTLKDVRIYTRALSTANIQRIMTGPDVEPIEELQ